MTANELKSLWVDANGDYLPEIDKEVIALEGLEEDDYRVVFAHRVDSNEVIRTTINGEAVELLPKGHGKAGWNIPNIKYWLNLELPETKENDKGEINF